MNSQTMNSIKRIVPKPLLDALWAYRRGGSWFAKRALLDHIEQPWWKRRYIRLNKDAPADVQVMHRDIRFRVMPEVRRIFELYSYLDMRNVCEMQGFIKYARNRTCLLDLGALYGDFSLVFSAMTGGVSYAVDPSPEAQLVMKQLMGKNPELRIEAFAMAVGGESAVIEMAFEWIHCVDPRGAASQSNTIKVQQKTMDDFVRGLANMPDVVKIDVEGAELDVIRGGKAYLAEHSPRLFIEVHPTYLQRRGQSAAELVKQLEDMGYRIFHSDGEPVEHPETVLGLAEGYLVHRVICDKSKSLKP